MKIVVDADACPVRNIIVAQAQKYGLEVLMVCDTCHELNDGYSRIVVVDKGPDSADIALIKLVEPKDIVVSQDIGVCAMALGKKARAITPSGVLLDESNLDQLLMERFLGKKLRRAGKHIKGPHKRSPESDKAFLEQFTKLLNN